MTGVAITETLFIGECPFDHVAAVTTDDALAAYLAGKTVTVPDIDMAYRVLLRSGLDPDLANQRVRFAQQRLASGR